MNDMIKVIESQREELKESFNNLIVQYVKAVMGMIENADDDCKMEIDVKESEPNPRVRITAQSGKDVFTTGTGNRTMDGKYVLYLDYDMMRIEYVIPELKHIQDLWEIGDIHIFKSSDKGFHAISYTKLPAKDFKGILNGSSCDMAFKNIPDMTSYRNWVLRHFEKGATPRPEYVMTLPSPTEREQSTAHHKFISLLY